MQISLSQMAKSIHLVEIYDKSMIMKCSYLYTSWLQNNMKHITLIALNTLG